MQFRIQIHLLIRTAVKLLGLATCGALVATSVLAAPVIPSSDDEVVEKLPTRLIGMPRLSTQPSAVAPGRNGAAFAEVAAARATRLLNEARDRGDPRYAGYALAAIAPWKSDPAPPARIAIVAATLAQYQHDFDGSRRILENVVARDPGNPQAFLTLATIARVQGRYADSDNACRQVLVALYRSACLAENMALRGDADEARRTINSLLDQQSAGGSNGVDIERWLTTTIAELEERRGNVAAADVAYRRALALGRDSYLTLDYVDYLLAHDRTVEADRLLVAEPQPFGDGVLLRLAIARKNEGAQDADALASEMRARFDAARERGDAISIHGRELARHLLALQNDATAAVEVARENLRIQKEPADFLVMAAAARAAGDRSAVAEVASEAKKVGLMDVRLAKLVNDDAVR